MTGWPRHAPSALILGFALAGFSGDQVLLGQSSDGPEHDKESSRRAVSDNVVEERTGQALVPHVAGVERFGRHGDIDEVATGRLLVSESSCAACHPCDDPLLAAKGGPSLRNAGLRLNADWMMNFIAHPAATDPGTTMPDVLVGKSEVERREIASSIAAYLTTQQSGFAALKASGRVPVPFEYWKRGDVDQGNALFHRVGCVACHEPDPDQDLDPAHAPPSLLDQLDEVELIELGLWPASRVVMSVPFPDLSGKYTRRGLTRFLLKPESVRADGRMPDLKLSPVEAAAIASYLVSRFRGDLNTPSSERPDSDLVDKGHRWFAALNCANCHETDDDFELEFQTPWNRLPAESGAGCAGAASAPVSYGFDVFQVTAIDAAKNGVTEAGSSSKDHQEKEDLRHRFLQLNCFACHEWESLGGVGPRRRSFFETVGDVDLGDEGRLPPSLTNVGRKLNPTWMAKLISGQTTGVRPHMTIRMPKFAKEISESVASSLAVKSLPPRHQPPAAEVLSQRAVAAAGRQLMDIGCVQCHSFNGFALPGVVGVDLSKISARIHPGWFAEFLRDPGALKSRTRMPSFFAGGRAQDQKLLGGNVDRQIDAMWVYLEDVAGNGLPQKILDSRAQDYELVPQDRPVLLRTFMPNVGTHAIAVGTPQQIHFAFDAERVRLSSAWRGRFLDAQGTWFIRFAPPAEPLGEDVVDLQREPSFVSVEDSGDRQRAEDAIATQPTARFGGYRLDALGVPTFLYHFGELAIEDRIEPWQDGALLRTWRVSREPVNHASRPDLHSEHGPTESSGIACVPLSGKTLRMTGDAQFRLGESVSVSIKELHSDVVPTLDDGRLLLPLVDESKQTIQVIYRW
ncbi:MAG: cytochrome oxidase [Planctomycetota bacterium]